MALDDIYYDMHLHSQDANKGRLKHNDIPPTVQLDTIDTLARQNLVMGRLLSEGQPAEAVKSVGNTNTSIQRQVRTTDSRRCSLRKVRSDPIPFRFVRTG